MTHLLLVDTTAQGGGGGGSHGVGRRRHAVASVDEGAGEGPGARVARCYAQPQSVSRHCDAPHGRGAPHQAARLRRHRRHTAVPVHRIGVARASLACLVMHCAKPSTATHLPPLPRRPPLRPPVSSFSRNRPPPRPVRPFPNNIHRSWTRSRRSPSATPRSRTSSGSSSASTRSSSRWRRSWRSKGSS